MTSAHANEIPTQSKRSCNAFGGVYPRCASVNGCIMISRSLPQLETEMYLVPIVSFWYHLKSPCGVSFRLAVVGKRDKRRKGLFV